jgi:hypothetical protein
MTQQCIATIPVADVSFPDRDSIVLVSRGHLLLVLSGQVHGNLPSLIEDDFGQPPDFLSVFLLLVLHFVTDFLELFRDLVALPLNFRERLVESSPVSLVGGDLPFRPNALYLPRPTCP